MRPVVAVLIFIVTVAATVMNACDNVRLSMVRNSVAASAKAEAEVCAAPPEVRQSYTKIMFLVDESGSNFGDPTNGVPGTDPDKQFRFNTINDFLTKNASNLQIKWGFIAFQGSGSRAFVNTGSDQSATFGTAGQMTAALARFKTDTDMDLTPYRSAMTMAMNAIQADRLSVAAMNDGSTSSYVVVLISDGMPTDYNVAASNPPVVDELAIDSDVARLVALNSSLSTIYYGPSDDTGAANRLNRMANEGGGKFSNVNLNGQVPVDKLISLSVANPWVIKRFVVTNLNAAPCEDGTIDADSDADGICDKDERDYNTTLGGDPTFSARMQGVHFDPQNRNSFSSVYNDLIFYRHIVYGEAIDNACVAVSDEDHDLLNDCEEKFIRSDTPSGPTPNWSQLMAGDADPKNPDSDGDGFLDFHEFVFALGRTTADTLQFSSPQKMINGYSVEQILEQHRNPRNPAAGTPYDGVFQFSRVNSLGQNCYSYNQTVLPLYKTLALDASKTGGHPELAHAAGENVVMIYFIQTAEKDINGPGELRYIFQKINVGDPNTQSNVNLNFNFDSYLSYKATQARVSPTANAASPTPTPTPSPTP